MVPPAPSPPPPPPQSCVRRFRQHAKLPIRSPSRAMRNVLVDASAWLDLDDRFRVFDGRWRFPQQLPMQREIRRWRPSCDAKIVLNIKGARGGMKTRVTLRIDSDLLREARVLAADEGRSLGALLSALVVDLVRDRKAFHEARRRALTRLRRGLDLQWNPPRSRHSLHER